MNFEKKCQEVLSDTIKRISDFDWESPESYALWSAQTFYFVRHSTRLLALAAARCPLDGNNFHMKYIRHLDEEKGHEKLSLKDVNALNFDLEELVELPETKALYQTQYYWIDHKNPYSFYGYILTLEGLSVYAGTEVYNRIKQAHGDRAAKFLKVHTEEDVGHLSEVYEWLNKMDESSKEQVYENLVLSAKLYSNMMVAIADKASQYQAQTKAA